VTLSVFVTGQKAFGAAVAEMVAGEGYDLVGVASPAWADPFGHLFAEEVVEGARYDRLRFAADRLNVPWTDARHLRPSTVPGFTDVIIAAHSHAFIGRETRARARVAVGYHPSLLPLHRGRDAVRWAVYNRERVLGGSVYHLEDRVDAGPIAAQQYIIIGPADTAESVWRERLFPLGLTLLKRVLEDVEAGRMLYEPQDESLATWEPSWERPPLFKPELRELPAPAGRYQGIELISREEWLAERTPC
jgi:methionyl-tRNA formyltransferase